MSFLQIPIGTDPNTFLGYEALRSVVITPGSGILNTAFGFNALKSLVSGSRNTAIGNVALRNNQTGDDNTAVGNQVMRIANNAFGNVGVGHQAFYSLTTGSFNIGIGWLSLFDLTTGGDNTAIGPGSGRLITTGSDNSILGGFSGNQGPLDIRTLSNYIVLSDGAGNPRLWIDNTGAANIPGGLALTGSLSITGGTVTANNPVLSATQTWNNAAVTFTGWQLNITDTASNAASLLMDLQVGGVSKFRINKFGNVFVGPDVGGSLTINLQSNSNGVLDFYQGGNYRHRIEGVLWIASSGGAFSWSSGTSPTLATVDLLLFRDAANTLAQRNGVNAQTLRVYNTFTDASNYERGKIEWASNVLRIGTEKAGTGTARGLEFQTDGTTRWVIAASSNNLTSDMGGVGVVGFEGGSVFTASGSVFKSRGIAYLDSTTGAVNLRPGGVTALSATSSGILVTGYTEMSEQTAPAAPAANSVRIYAEDNGSGKTRLMALFATGAAQQIAIEP